VVRTRAGYTGGRKERPTYHDLGDHSEAVQVDFDPRRISYERLLEVAWDEHNPASRSWSRQYRAAIFVHDESQRAAAQESRARIAASLGTAVHTPVEDAGVFWPAEDYHQKYMLRRSPALVRELLRRLPDEPALRDSTVAARLNGVLGGYRPDGLEEEIGRWGLAPETEAAILGLAGRARR
jgi:methionine-S-sulfoxide reductase